MKKQKLLKYCKKCLMPNTRPNLRFVDDVCIACINYEKQKSVDWNQRWKELEKLCDKYRGSNGNGYDCAIGVSGGKDSHFQTYIIKEKLKMNPVLITSGNVDWTETGIKNLENLSESFGVDIIMKQQNRKLTRKMFRKTFEKIGSPSWFLDYQLNSIPVRMSIKLGVKLLVYGENVNYTYGGEYDEETPSAMLQPLNDVSKPIWNEWFDDGEISEQDLDSIKQPTIDECKNAELNPIYLSYFVPWNSHHNFQVAQRWGFKHLGHEYIREGSIDNYDQIDSLSYLLNPYLKYLKFGHSVATDNASRWIRYGIKSREEMIPVVEDLDPKLDQGIVEKFCEFTNYTIDEFWSIMDKWYNPELFEKDSDGIWHPKFKVGKGLIK
jgi:N-acetyl sugar amidotransferase